MRISGGDARGIRLRVPKGIRPAAERVRQAVFSSLVSAIPEARVLDLFAGSGAYGLEAVSRGAASAVLVDKDREAAAVCRANARAAGLDERVTVRVGDVGAYLARRAAADGPFDLVFVDPPYGHPLGRTLEAIRESLDDDGRVVVEMRSTQQPPPEAGGMVVEADRRYGDTRVVVFSRGEMG